MVKPGTYGAMVGVGDTVGVGETVGLGLGVGVGETVGVGDSVGVGVGVLVASGVMVKTSSAPELPGSVDVGAGVSLVEEIFTSSPEAVFALGFAKEPANITTKKQIQVAAKPINARCLFFIVNPDTFLISRYIPFYVS